MWEAYDLGNEDTLWAGTTFLGGIGGQQQAPCGVVSAAAVCLGLLNRCPLDDEQKTQQARNKARQDAGEIVTSFRERFGTIFCRDLVGLDFSQPGAYRQFLQSGIWKEKCDHYVQFTIEKLYELDAR